MHESSMHICTDKQYEMFTAFITAMNSITIMLLDDIENDLPDISNTRDLVEDGESDVE